jgi:hypothetical protein
MMPPEELRGFLRAQPFRPFRVNLTDGRHFDVRHPDMMLVGVGFVVIGIPQPREADPLAERSVTLSTFHIVSAEALEAPARQGEAGS